jgi:ribosome maturation factor RimP
VAPEVLEGLKGRLKILKIKMITKEQVAILSEEAFTGTDRFLVEVKVKPNNVIEVYVDSDTAVNIDHCAELSRYINEKLDRDVEDYELTVLSWGLSGALKMDRQLQKYVGKDVEVKTKEMGKLQGKLVSFDAEKVEFAPAPKKTSKKKPVEEPANLFFERNKVEIKPAIIF